MPGHAKTTLRERYEKNSARAERLAWLIIVGLLVEIASVPALGRSWLEGALTIAADALIAIGVWGEIHFEKIAREAGDGIVAEANARASEAEARAAESIAAASKASLELEKLRAKVGPRVIDRDKFLEAISAKPKASRVFIMYSQAAPDGWFVASQLKAFLTDAGWRVSPSILPKDPSDPVFNVGPAISLEGPSSGIRLVMNADTGPEHASIINGLMVALTACLGTTGGTTHGGVSPAELWIVIFGRP